MQAACSQASEGPSPDAAAAWQATIADMSAVWPPIRQLLLAGAVQRLTERNGQDEQSGAQHHSFPFLAAVNAQVSLSFLCSLCLGTRGT